MTLGSTYSSSPLGGLPQGVAVSLAVSLVVSLAACGAPGIKGPIVISDKMRDHQTNFVDQVVAVNIAGLLSENCGSIDFDDAAHEAAAEGFIVRALVLAEREGKGTDFVDAYLSQTTKLRKSDALRNSVATQTKEYWDTHFDATSTEKTICAQAQSENKRGTGIGQFLTAS